MKQSRTWWHNRSRAFLAECARLVEQRIGSDAIDGIFLCGSFASREESIVLETDPPILLSDVDLVVVGKPVREIFEWSRRRAELGAACEALFREIRFSGRVEVGVMIPETLRSQSAKPGVYDMKRLGVVLSGAPAILDVIPAYDPADIKAREAFTLLENRVIALLNARPDGSVAPNAEPYDLLYQAARVYTDIAVAALAIAGKYSPGYVARRDSIREKIEGGKDPLLSDLVGPELLSKIDRWTRFKIDPSLEAAAVTPGPETLRGIWTEAAEDILAFWRRSAMRLLDCGGDCSKPLSVAAIVGRNRDYGAWRDHLRSWRMLLAKVPGGGKIALAAALRTRLISAGPLDIVREHGMELLESLLTRGPDAPVRGSRWGFPHYGGDWKAASARLCSTWQELVFGRADE